MDCIVTYASTCVFRDWLRWFFGEFLNYRLFVSRSWLIYVPHKLKEIKKTGFHFPRTERQADEYAFQLQFSMVWDLYLYRFNDVISVAQVMWNQVWLDWDWVTIRAAESGFGPWLKRRFRPPPPSKGGPATDLYTKSYRLTVTCRVTWAWSEGVNLYNRQLMALPGKTKTYATHWRPGPFPDSGALVNCTGLRLCRRHKWWTDRDLEESWHVCFKTLHIVIQRISLVVPTVTTVLAQGWGASGASADGPTEEQLCFKDQSNCSFWSHSFLVHVCTNCVYVSSGPLFLYG
jgi:hypothetical protein